MDRLQHFDSLAAFGKACSVRLGYDCRDEWAGGTKQQALGYCERGDLSSVDAARRLVDRIMDGVTNEGVTNQWETAVVGAMPCVPNYIAGVPDAMLARSTGPSDLAPVEIWANTTVSANCKHEDMTRRGVVTMAMAMALERTGRPVSVVLYSTLQGSVNVAIHMSTPIDTSEFCAAFCQPCVTRHLVYGYGKRYGGFDGTWAPWCTVLTSKEEERRHLERLGMPADAIHLNTETLGSYSKKSDDELVEILNGKIAEFMNRAE